MCAFIVIVIMIALVLFLPSAYLLGARSQHATGGNSANIPAVDPKLAPGTSIPSTQPPTVCTRCQKAKICADPPHGLSVFC